MVRKYLLLACLCVLSRSASAAISLYVDGGTNTQNLQGFKTYQIYITDSLAREITALDLHGDGSTGPFGGNGIFGPMNQVNPAGLPTIFNDNNSFFASIGAFTSQDSQFKFSTSNVLHIANYSRESANQLQSVFGIPSGIFTNNTNLAQIVVPNQRASRVTYAGAVAFRTGEIERFEGTLLEAIPEPSTFVLAIMVGGVVALLTTRRRRVSAELDPIGQ